jgi:hypothetical protein
MASTNKTTHYNLSQYIGNDKPTYLVDYNTDMANIDAGIYGAKAEADANSGAIGNLSNLETTDKSSLVGAINEVKGETSEIGNLSNLTTDANNNLVSAINEVDAHADANNQNIGSMVNLETTVKTSLVGAVNEVNGKVGNLSNLTTSANSNLVSAINEVNEKTDIYSTSETITNKVWIDGRPIYRKVINFGALPNTGTKRVSTGLTNVTYIHMDSLAENSTGVVITIPDTGVIISRILINSDHEIEINVQGDRSDYIAYIILEYVKNN